MNRDVQPSASYVASNDPRVHFGLGTATKAVNVSVQWPGILGVGMAAAMDERVRVDSSMSVDVGTVKQVLHQVLGQARQPEASPSVQAVLPRSLLDALARFADRRLARDGDGLAVELGRGGQALAQIAPPRGLLLVV